MKLNTNISELSRNRKNSLPLTPFERAMSNSPVANILAEKDGTIVFANSAASKLFEYTEKELISVNMNQLFEEFVHSDLMEDQCLGFYAIQKSGTRFYTEVYVNNFEDEGVSKTNFIIVNASEKVGAQAIDLNLSFFFNNIEDHLLLISKEYKVLLFNDYIAKGIKRRYGIDLAKGMDALVLAPEEYKENIYGIYDKVFQGDTVELNINVPGTDEKQIHYHALFKPARSKSGDILAALVVIKNVTEKRETEVRMQETDERWRFALEGSGQGVWDWNIKTGETFFSPGWKKMLGFGEGDMSNHISEWESRLHPEDVKKMTQNIEEHLQTSDPYHESEYRLKAKDGSYKWILARGMIVSKDENGKPLRMIGTHTDITERKRIEGNYKLLFYNNPLPMWTYDRHTLKFVTVNNAAIAHYGYSREEFLNMTILDIRPEEDKETIRRNTINNTVPDQVISRQFWRHIKKNGEIIYVNITGYSFGEGNSIQTLILSEDVTEKVIAENRLKNSERQYKTLFNNNPLPSYIYEVGTLKFLEVNEAAIHHYGYSKEEFGNISLLDIHLPETQKQLKQSVKKFKLSDHLNVEKWKQKKKSGEVIIADTSSSKIEYNGIDARLVVINDVTEKVKAEEELREINNRFQLVTEATSDIIFDWNLADNTVLWAGNYEKIFANDLLQDKLVQLNNLLERIHPNDFKPLMKSRDASLADPSSKHWNDEYRFRKADGQYAYIKQKSFIIRNEAGKAVRVIGAFSDISEMKLKELQLLEGNERYNLATKATSDVIYDWHFDTGVLHWSEGILPTFGWSIEEVLMETWENLIHDADKQEIFKSLEIFTADPSRNNWQGQYRFKRKDGTYSHVLDRCFIVRDEEGQPVRLIGAMQDISILKQNEQQLLASNERFQFASSATSDIIWDWNVKTGKVLWSDNYQKVMGWQLPPDKYLDFDSCVPKFYPDDRERIIRKMQETIGNPDKTIWEDEFRYQRADGSFAFIVDRGFIIRDEKGEAQRIIGAMQDISERKYQEELQSLELRVFEVSAVPGMQFNNVLKTFIDGYENLSPGIHTSVCLLGLNDEIEIVAPRLSKEHTRQLRYFIEKQKSKLSQQPSTQKNIIVSSVDSDDWKYGIDTANYYKWKVSWTVPVYNHTGELLAFITIFLDQQRNPSEHETNSLIRLRNLLRILIVNHLSLEQIRLFTERYDNVLKATHDMVWDWNLETGIFYRNAEGVRKVYGIEDVESIQNVYSWMERIHPEDHIKVQNVINNILHATQEDTFDVEYRFKQDDDQYAFIYDRGIIVRNKEGKPLRMIGAAQNVTDRKRLEQQLLQKELDKQKSISQATIDTQEEERREIGKELHDNVNQVLTTTKLYLDLSLTSPDLKDELIKKSSKNIIYVINEIRQLSRSLMDPSIGDLGLIDSINDLVDNINITRKLHVSLSANSELEKYLEESQKLMVFRIIQEAMNNTIKYAQATSVHISIKQNKGHAELQIVDDGKGFNPETVKKGAGLKNIQNRVYLTNGKLAIDTAPGKGCKIIISFPINNHKKSN